MTRIQMTRPKFQTRLEVQKGVRTVFQLSIGETNGKNAVRLTTGGL